MPKSTDNRASHELIGAVAFELAALNRLEDPTEEFMSLIDKVSAAQRQVQGGLGEVLAATENLLHCMQQETLHDIPGSLQTLLDVAQFLHASSSAGQTLDEDLEEIDELLERIDFVASGGAESELTRPDSSTQSPPTEFRKLRFPIDAPADAEDPVLASIVERLLSTGRLLHSHGKSCGNTPIAMSLAQHNQDLDSLVRRLQEQSHSPLSSLGTTLRDIFSATVDGRGCDSRVQIGITPSDPRIFKSLASLLFPRVELLCRVLCQLLLSNIDGSMAIEVQTEGDELKVLFNLIGLKSRYSKRMATTVSTVLATGFDASTKGIEEDSREVEVEDIGLELAQLISATRRVGGSLRAESRQPNSFTIEMRVPSDTRIFSAHQLSLDSNPYAVEANLVQGIVPACVAECDFNRNVVVHEKQSYKYMSLGVGRPIHDIDVDDWGMLVLLQSENRHLALRADEVGDIIQTTRQPSSSDIAMGNVCTGDSEATLVLDLNSTLESDSDGSRNLAKGHLAMHRIYLCNTSDETTTRFDQAVSGMSVDCEHLVGISQTIATIQEQRPTLLVAEMSGKGDGGLEHLARIGRYAQIPPKQWLILVDSSATQGLDEQARFSSLLQAPIDASVNELRDLLRKTLGLQGFAASHERD